MQGWLLGAYLDLAGLRISTSFLLKHATTGVTERQAMCLFGLVVGCLLPFLLAWTILGTVWYMQAVHEECVRDMQLPKEEQPWLFVMLLVFSYSILALFVIVFLTTCGRIIIFTRRDRRLMQALVVIPDDLDSERPLNAAELLQLSRHVQRYRAGRDLATCTICCDDFSVTSTQTREKVLKLPGCGHCFHSPCAADWLKIKALCPYCKNNVRTALH